MMLLAFLFLAGYFSSGRLTVEILLYTQEASLPTAEPKMTRAMAKTLSQAGDVVPWIGGYRY